MQNPLTKAFKNKWFKQIVILFILNLPYIVHSNEINSAQVTSTKANTTNSLPDTLLILGDSLSAGYGLQLEQAWASLLAEQWQQQFPNRQIINASISGDTTSGGLNRLPNLLDQYKPKWVLIELGGNDGLRGFQLPTIKQNLIKLVQLVEQNNAQPILAEIKIPPNYGKRYVTRFIKQYHEIANEYQLDLIPFFIESVATNPELMQNDGIHPNEKAQSTIQKYMDKALNQAMIDNE